MGMRTLTFVLVAAVIAVAAAFYVMVTTEGEGQGNQTPDEIAGEKPAGKAAGAAGGPSQGHAVNWLANLERHDPPKTIETPPFRNAEGEEVTLANFRGQGVVVNLWATWCGPCVREMPSLNRLQEQVADDGIAVVAVSSDRGGLLDVEPFLAKHDLDLLKPYLDQKAQFTQALPGRGLPRTYIFDAEGKLAATYVGPAEWDEPEMVAAVRELAS